VSVFFFYEERLIFSHHAFSIDVIRWPWCHVIESECSAIRYLVLGADTNLHASWRPITNYNQTLTTRAALQTEACVKPFLSSLQWLCLLSPLELSMPSRKFFTTVLDRFLGCHWFYFQYNVLTYNSKLIILSYISNMLSNPLEIWLNLFRVRRLLRDDSFNFVPIVVISEIIFLFTLLNFLQTAFTDPGVLQKGITSVSMIYSI
jgi:hypothetical protein